jgi:hypothetical protein
MAPGAGAGVPILPQHGVFAAVLPAGPFTLQLDWAGAVVTEPGRASAQLPQLSAGTIRVTIDAPGEGSDLTIDRALVTRRARAQGRCSSTRRFRRAADRASAGRRVTPGRPRRSARCDCSTT